MHVQNAKGKRLIFLALISSLLAFSLSIAAQQTDEAQTTLAELESKFEAAVKQAYCGERDNALKFGRELIEAYGDDPTFALKLRVVRSEMKRLERIFNGDDSLEVLFSEFKACRKCPCGQRSETIRIGRRIIELHRSDELNQAVIQYIEKTIPLIEQEDAHCQLVNKYNQSYKKKDWPQFLSLSDRVLVEVENDKDRLDVALTAAGVAYEQYLETNESHYLGDAVRYAQKAVELIESGVDSRWGTYNPFRSRAESLTEMNKIINHQTTKN